MIFIVFSIIERVFFKGIHRKTKSENTFRIDSYSWVCIFKNKNVKYFKSPNTVHHENRYFSEHKKVLQYKNPLKTNLKI